MTEPEERELRALLADPARWGDGSHDDLLPELRSRLRGRRRRRRAGVGVAAGVGASILLVGGVALVGTLRDHSSTTLTAGGATPPAPRSCELVLKPGFTVPKVLNDSGGLVVPLVNRDGTACSTTGSMSAFVYPVGGGVPSGLPFQFHPVLGADGQSVAAPVLAAGHVAVVSIRYPSCASACFGRHWLVTLVDGHGQRLVTIPAYSSEVPVFTGLRVE